MSDLDHVRLMLISVLRSRIHQGNEMATKKDVVPVPQLNLVDALNKMLQDALKKVKDPSETTDVMWDGTHITLPAEPEPMPIRKAIEVLIDKAAADEQEYDLLERIPGMPLDAAHAFIHVLKKRYGWAAAKTKQTWFGPQPPVMQMVQTGPHPDDYVEVPTGLFKLHDISTNIETGFTRPSDKKKSQFMDFYIKATVNYADRAVIMDLISDTRAYLAENSIYKGKALRLTFGSGGALDALIQPIFIDLSKVDVTALTLNDDVQDLVDVNLMTPIRKTDACRKHKIPLKRGILLYGPYGTGKTLSALVTAKTAFENGWTFVMLDKADALAQALEFARQFQPCVVFAEDIDRVVDTRRTDDANDIINTIDGMLDKNAEVITVLTTNHIGKIPPVMLRNGRLDALIPINLPNAKASERLVRHYAGPLLGAAVDLDGLGQKMEASGFIPATIREVVERSKLSMLMDERKELISKDLHTSTFALKAHADLLQDRPSEPSPAERLGIAFKQLLETPGDGTVNFDDEFGDIKNEIGNTQNTASAIYSEIENIQSMMKKLSGPGNNPQLAEILQKITAVQQHVTNGH